MCAKTTVKCIIKYALILETIVSIIGQLGELAIRHQEYIDFFQEQSVARFDIYSILIAIAVVFLIVNLVFIVAVIYELIIIIILVIVIWTVHLCMSLTYIAWVIKPTVFTLLIISILLILSIILISLVIDERNRFQQKRKRQNTPIKLINVNDLDEL